MLFALVAVRSELPHLELFCQRLRATSNTRSDVRVLAFDSTDWESTNDYEVDVWASLKLPSLPGWLRDTHTADARDALAPHYIRWLLDQGADTVVYAAPGIVPLGDLTSAVEGFPGSVVLVPHLIDPSGKTTDDYVSALQRGVYSSRVMVLRRSPESRAFLDWIASRLTEYRASDQMPNSAVRNSAWLDLTPARFDGVRVCRDPAWNVSAVNARERELEYRGPNLYAKGMPVVFADMYSDLLQRPTSTLIENPPAAFLLLLSDYLRELVRHGLTG